MIRQIAAIDSRRGIATDSGIPWKLPGDTAYFHEKTAKGLILMGFATYSEFAAPLHGKENFVLSTRHGALRMGFRAVASLDELHAAHPEEDIWVIGGASVYAETIAEATELLLTQVAAISGAPSSSRTTGTRSASPSRATPTKRAACRIDSRPGGTLHQARPRSCRQNILNSIAY